MRILALALLAGALAAESFPVLTVTYGGDGPAPVEPIAGWWREAVAEAAAGFAVEVESALPPCLGLRLIGVGMPGGQSGPTPWAAGWWHAAPPGLAPALRNAVAEWPGYVVEERDGRLHLCAPGMVGVSDEAPPPGWRATLHGVAVLRSVEAIVPADDLLPWRALLEVLTRQDLVAAVEPDGPAWIASALPARWFMPPDAGLVAGLPAGALVSAGIGIDGAAIATDLAALVGPLPDELDEFQREAGTDLAGLAHALTGTWAFALTGAGQGLAILPRSAPLDRLFARAATEQKTAIPTDGSPIALGDFSLACRARCWLVADRAAAIAAYATAPPTPPVAAPGALGWAHASEAATLALATLPGEVLAQWPLPRRLLGWPSTQAGQLAPFIDRVPPIRGWITAVGRFAGAGDHHLDLRADGARIRLDLHGPLLPWLVPGAALRWFTDHAQDLSGRAKLRRRISAWREAGLGALPEDLAALVPAVAPEAVAETLALYRTLPIPNPQMPVNENPWNHARREFLPVTPPLSAPWLEGLSALVAASAPLSGPGWPAASAVSVRLAQVDGTLGPGMANPQLQIASRLAAAGRVLAAFGDPAGIALVDRALVLAEAPLSLLAEATRAQVRGLRDDAWLAGAIARVIPPERLAAWAAEPPPTVDPRVWQGERLLSAWGAAAWLELPTAAPPRHQEWFRLLAAPAIWQPHVVRATTAADHAALGELLLSRERGEPLPADWEPPQSPLAMETAMTVLRQSSLGTQPVARHRLVRLAWKLHGLAQAGALPADQAAAAAALGPLTIPWGTTTLPLAYARHGRGFRLAIDASGERPAAIDAGEWRRLGGIATKLAAPGLRLMVSPSAVVLSPGPALAPGDAPAPF